MIEYHEHDIINNRIVILSVDLEDISYDSIDFSYTFDKEEVGFFTSISLIELVLSLKKQLKECLFEIRDNNKVVMFQTCIQLILARDILLHFLSNISDWNLNKYLEEQMSVQILKVLNMMVELEEIQYWRTIDCDFEDNVSRIYWLEYFPYVIEEED